MWKHRSQASSSALNDLNNMLSTSQVLWSKLRLTMSLISSGILFIMTGTSRQPYDSDFTPRVFKPLMWDSMVS